MFIITSGGEERMIDWIMYAEIHNLKRQGFKKAKVAKKLGIRKRCQALLRKFYKTLQFGI